MEVSISEEAATDIMLQAAWYDEYAGPDVSLRYLQAVASARDRLRLAPLTGKPRRFSSPKLRGVRSLPAATPFDKHLIFYRLSEELIIVLRVVHGARNLPELLQEPPGI